MALVQVFEFQELASQLTEQETHSFFAKLFKFDPGLIIHALSSHFINRLKDANDSAQNAQCNKIISTIIRSRETDTHHEEENKRLDRLAKRIIGLCASYLDQMSYAALTAANRSCYLGCNGPNMLSEVNYRRGFRNPYPDLSAFPFATKFCLPGILSTDEARVIPSQISKMPRLYSLDLKRTWSKLISLIANDDVTNGRIKSAVFRHQSYGTSTGAERVRCQQFIDVIAGFKYIQFLKVRIEGNPDPEHDWNTNTLIESLSNLKALDFDDASKGIEWKILQSVGHRLECLTLHDPEEHFLNSAEQKQIDFVNLRLLWQEDGCVSDCIRIIMKTAFHLEKVRLPEKSPLLEEVLSKCEELKYLEIDVVETWGGYGSLNDVLQTMERSLFTNKTLQRESMKIRINISFAVIADNVRSKEQIITLNRLIKSFSENKVDQWMFILHIKRKDKEKDVQLIHFARALISDICSTAVLDCENYIAALITNPNCSICGWRESWLMSR